MSKSAIIDKLNDILKHEWTGVAQYAQQSFLVRGLWRAAYEEVFSDSAKECFGHAKRVGDKIVAYGGVPTIERNKVKQSHDVQTMLEDALEFEQQAVQGYLAALKVAEDDRALVVLLEDLLLEEQDGVDEMEKLVREHSAASASNPAKGKAG